MDKHNYMKAKFIYENINFERKQDKMSSLGVGKIHLIKSWLDEMEVKNYVINDDFTIDVKYDVDLYDKNLIEFPDYIQFNEVGGFFSCFNNQLTSLRGCPKIVNRFFRCDYNQLTSLKGCPEYVNLSFYCQYNKKQFTINEVRKYCDVKGTIYVKI